MKDYKNVNYDLTCMTKGEEKKILSYVKQNGIIDYQEAMFVLDNSSVKRKLDTLVYNNKLVKRKEGKIFYMLK